MKLRRPEAEAAVFLASQPMTLNAAITARITGPLTQERLRAALDRIGERHPLLAVRAVADADGGAYFTDEGAPPISLRVVDRVNDLDWVAESDRDTRRKTSYLTERMIRCIWIRGGDVSDLILVCDHIVADGRSAIIVLRDLLSLLADPAMSIEPILAPPVPELVPPEVLERIRAAYGAPQGEEGQPPGTPTPGTPAAAPRPPQALGPACIAPFELSAPETSALVERCRSERVTVQAAICAAFLTPFAEREPDRPVRRAEIPVDLRSRFSRPVGDSYGNMIGLKVIEFDCTPGRNLWDVARDAAAALAGMRDEELFATVQVQIALFGRVPNRSWGTGYDISISNLGRIDIPATYGDLRLEAVFGSIFPATRPEHRILGVSTFGGQLRATFSSRDQASAPLMSRGVELLRGMIA